MNVFPFVQWCNYFHSLKDWTFYSTRLNLSTNEIIAPLNSKTFIICIQVEVCKNSKESLNFLAEYCSEGWEANGKFCYYMSLERMNFSAAEESCQNLDSNLTSIHSLEEQMYHLCKILISLIEFLLSCFTVILYVEYTVVK